jgi:hypothetical protein
MNPQQQYGGFPAPPSSNPYEFITNPAKPPKPKTGPLGGNSIVGIIIAVVASAIALIIVVVIIMNIAFSGKGNFNSMIKVAQTQTELARVAALGKQGLSDSNVAGAAVNTRLTMLTQQQRVVTYLGTNSQKVDSKRLALLKDTTVDKQFQTAKATSTFDLVFTQVMRQQLVDYAAVLKNAHKQAPGNEARKLLAADYEQTALLLKQWPEK